MQRVWLSTNMFSSLRTPALYVHGKCFICEHGTNYSPMFTMGCMHSGTVQSHFICHWHWMCMCVCVQNYDSINRLMNYNWPRQLVLVLSGHGSWPITTWTHCGNLFHFWIIHLGRPVPKMEHCVSFWNNVTSQNRCAKQGLFCYIFCIIWFISTPRQLSNRAAMGNAD